MGITTEISHFRKFGPGISLFFEFQWNFLKAFFLMALISLIPIIYNGIVGPVMSTKGSTLPYSVAKTTIGNFSSSHPDYQILNKIMNVVPDILVILVFIIFYFFWLRKGRTITE